MFRKPLPLLLGMLVLAAPFAPRADVICETKRTPVRLSKTIYVIEARSRCYHPEQTETEKLLTACNLLIAAYGSKQGQARCRALLESR